MSDPIVIVGAGLAGVATAWALAERGRRDVLLLDREPAPGMHSSGRNAGMVRTHLADPILAELVRQSLPVIHRCPSFRCTGALYLAPARPDRPPASSVAHPLVDPAAYSIEHVAAEDGVVDPHSLLRGWLERATSLGVRWKGSTVVLRLRVAAGRVAGVETPDGFAAASWVVNAAGAWAGDLAPGLPLRPTRRHLFLLDTGRPSCPSWPIVYVDDRLYFRPEGTGILASACDVEDHPPGVPQPSPGADEMLAWRLREAFPPLCGAGVRTRWAGLRTLTPDDRPIIGRDPRWPNLVWIAGLGGHGVSISAAAGRLAARAILDGEQHPMLTPRRFLREPAS